MALVLSPIALQPAFGQTAESSETARLERLERAVEQLQKRNAELEREVSALKKEPARTASAEAKPKPVADSKSVVEKTTVKEEKKPVYAIAAASEFKLTLGGFVQAQYEVGDVSAFEGRFVRGAGANKDRFRLRRARINVSGDYHEQFDFKLEGDFSQTDTGITVRDANGRTLASNSTRTSFGATDLFINWHRLPELNIKAGQYKAPFGLEQLTSDTKLFTIERSQVTSALTPERQIGVQIWGKPLTNLWPEQKELVTYYGGVFNGNGRNVSVNDNNEYMYVGRLEAQTPKAKWFNQEVGIKLGVNGLSSRDDAGTNLSPAGNLRVNSEGSLTSFTAPAAAERDAYGLDFSFRLGPFDLVGEYLSERIHKRGPRDLAPDFKGFRADGFYVQGSYFIIPKTLQLVAKYESFNPGQVANDDVDSITAGINYYIKGDDIKLLANYIHSWSEFRENNPALGRSDFDEVMVRLQLMF